MSTAVRRDDGGDRARVLESMTSVLAECVLRCAAERGLFSLDLDLVLDLAVSGRLDDEPSPFSSVRSRRSLTEKKGGAM